MSFLIAYNAKYNTSKTNDMKWINSTERLPANPNRGNYKLSDVVLVHVEYEPYNGNYHSTTAYYDYNDNKWKEIDGKWAEQEVGTKVTYWMELPEPPK